MKTLALLSLFLAQSRAQLTTISSILAAAQLVTNDLTFNTFINSVLPGIPPTSVQQVTAYAALASNESNGNPIAYIGLMKLNGVLNPLGEQASGCGQPCTSNNTGNPPAPNVYSRVPGDAPWDQTEESLMNSIYFPPGYTFGAKIPLLFVPGTGKSYLITSLRAF
jgi:hypothetical protein